MERAGCNHCWVAAAQGTVLRMLIWSCVICGTPLGLASTTTAWCPLHQKKRVVPAELCPCLPAVPCCLPSFHLCMAMVRECYCYWALLM